MRTNEQRHADAQLEEAVGATVDAYNLMPGAAVLVDFIVVIEGVKMEDEDGVSNEYFGMAFRYGRCRSVVALGLLEKGAMLLTDGERVGDDDA